mmetsp:Transcript_100251/g.269365  ORF Transcript_100251/g.269365 Transcript_100251/m.269365 type:complete len:399 (+) Transcript_100251:401-1597(+)
MLTRGARRAPASRPRRGRGAGRARRESSATRCAPPKSGGGQLRPRDPVERRSDRLPRRCGRGALVDEAGGAGDLPAHGGAVVVQPLRQVFQHGERLPHLVAEDMQIDTGGVPLNAETAAHDVVHLQLPVAHGFRNHVEESAGLLDINASHLQKFFELWLRNERLKLLLAQGLRTVQVRVGEQGHQLLRVCSASSPGLDEEAVGVGLGELDRLLYENAHDYIQNRKEEDEYVAQKAETCHLSYLLKHLVYAPPILTPSHGHEQCQGRGLHTIKENLDVGKVAQLDIRWALVLHVPRDLLREVDREEEHDKVDHHDAPEEGHDGPQDAVYHQAQLVEELEDSHHPQNLHDFENAEDARVAHIACQASYDVQERDEHQAGVETVPRGIVPYEEPAALSQES